MPHAALEKVLGRDAVRLLRALGEAAHEHGARLWLVGGAVRDAVLGRRILDIDLTSAMPAAELGPWLALELGGSAGTPTAFGTVKLVFGAMRMDLATTRTERYARPGALPEVAPGDVLQDLARRDLSINALALSLSPDDFEEILDTEGGLRDIDAGVVRVLHERSFEDDPTRMLRAVRYAARLGFRIESRTRGWLTRDLSHLDNVSGGRLRRELVRILEEDVPARALLLAHRLGILGAICPPLGTVAVADGLRRAARSELTPMAALGALVYPIPRDDAERVTARLTLTRRQAAVVEQTTRIAAQEAELARVDRLSQAARLAGDVHAGALAGAAAAARDPRARRVLRRYAQAKQRSPLLNGDEIAALGVPRGPRLGAMQGLLREAALDDLVRSKRGAIAYIKKALQEAPA